ncbi:hypothetical protein V6N11_013920 [Hibiscus sabdariffa]|uniref:Uncharacterized protein n=1 Tax=Hibiscus sabdariffa TaxID=183260 RepID=A0ABR1ZC57_9ROSI
MEDRPNERIDGMVEHNNLNTMEMRNVRVYEPVTTVTTRIFTKNVAHMNPNLDKKSKVAIKEQGEINVDEIGLNVGEDKALTRNNLKGAHSISLKMRKVYGMILICIALQMGTVKWKWWRAMTKKLHNFYASKLKLWIKENFTEGSLFSIYGRSWDIMLGGTVWKLWLRRNYLVFDLMEEGRQSVLKLSRSMWATSVRVLEGRDKHNRDVPAPNNGATTIHSKLQHMVILNGEEALACSGVACGRPLAWLKELSGSRVAQCNMCEHGRSRTELDYSFPPIKSTLFIF